MKDDVYSELKKKSTDDNEKPPIVYNILWIAVLRFSFKKVGQAITYFLSYVPMNMFGKIKFRKIKKKKKQ